MLSPIAFLMVDPISVGQILAQTDYESGHSRAWYLFVGLLLLTPATILVLVAVAGSRRNARVRTITNALADRPRTTVFELAQNLGARDPEALWRELADLRRSGALKGYAMSEAGKYLELEIPPDPWTCPACGAENDGRDGGQRCASCESARPNCK